MPTYRFHVAPDDSAEDVLVRCITDDEALNEAQRRMRDVLLEGAHAGKTSSKAVEVIREDGTIVGVVIADNEDEPS